jgi:putative RNA 2'-phosphotransferase
MATKRSDRVSRYLSAHLRHRPQDLGLVLGPGGWVPIDDLLRAAERDGFPIERAVLDDVVATSDKQRFAFDETRTMIRANQGHSAEVDLQLEPVAPPAVLFHGTAERYLPTIMEEGLRPMDRHHVHLSADDDTARKVGSRHGSPVVLIVDAAAMHAASRLFYRSANGVWLTDNVAPTFLAVQRTPI